MSWRTIASTSRHTFKRLNAVFRSHSTTFPSPHHSRAPSAAFLHAPFSTTTHHSARPTNALIDPRVHATHNDAVVDDEDTTSEFLSRFVWIMRKKVKEAYPEFDKATMDGMLVAIVERVTLEMEKGGGVEMGSGDFSEDLWGTVWEVSNLVLKDMDKERKKEKMKGFLQCEEVKEMCRFAGEVGIRGDLLRELRFKWAREKMEEHEFYEGLERMRKEAQNEEKERDVVGEEGKKEKVDVGLPKRKGKIRYKIYGLDLSDPKWAQVADRIHEAEEVFWPQEPKAITGKAKIVRSKILSWKEYDDGLQSLLKEWVELVEPSRVDWMDLLDSLKEQNHSLYLKVCVCTIMVLYHLKLIRITSFDHVFYSYVVI